MDISVILPLPHWGLSPNQSKGKSWRTTNAIKKADIDIGFNSAPIGIIFDESAEFYITLGFFLDSNRKDLDNLISSSKAMIDGVFRGLGINDNRIVKIKAYKTKDANYQRLELTLKELK